jgi:chorismate mutase
MGRRVRRMMDVRFFLLVGASVGFGTPQPRPRGASARPAASNDATFSLDGVRDSLIRQEETIIFALIERAQYAHNAQTYERDAYASLAKQEVIHPKLKGRSVSFLEAMLFETEQVHARARRYLSPEEHAFFPQDVARPALSELAYPPVLIDDAQNINPQVLDAYLTHVVPRTCSKGDDAQHGSSALADIAVLQALSRRIHYGKFVAEAKCRVESGAFEKLAAEGDIAGIHALLENVAVEDTVVRRAMTKAVVFGQDALSGNVPGYKVDPQLVANLYRAMIIPLTKQVQVTYLLRRLGHADKAPSSPEAWPPYLRGFALGDTEERETIGY